MTHSCDKDNDICCNGSCSTSPRHLNVSGHLDRWSRHIDIPLASPLIALSSRCRWNYVGDGGWEAVGSRLAGATLLASLNGYDLTTLRANGATELLLQQIQVGSQVKVLLSVSKPKHGWGSASHSSVGTVAAVNTNKLEELTCGMEGLSLAFAVSGLLAGSSSTLSVIDPSLRYSVHWNTKQNLETQCHSLPVHILNWCLYDKPAVVSC